MQKLLPGTVVDGKFSILTELGAGGMGAVYKARQLSFDRIVALKILHSGCNDAEEVERFKREAKILSLLSDKRIVQFLDYGLWLDKVPYIAMELVEFPSLRELINSRGQLPWKDVLKIGLEIFQALSYCHCSGVIHRDLKPENVFVSLANLQCSVKIADFGLSKVLSGNSEPNLTKSGILVGSIHYMSPEQARGERADARSDIYASACIIFELLAGKRPFEADSAAALAYLKNKEESPGLAKSFDTSSLPDDLLVFLSQMLAKDANLRPQTAKECAERIETILSGSLQWTDRIIPLIDKPGAESRQKQKIFLGIFLISAALFLLLTIVFRHAREDPELVKSESKVQMSKERQNQEKAKLEKRLEFLSKKYGNKSEKLIDPLFKLSALSTASERIILLERVIEIAGSKSSLESTKVAAIVQLAMSHFSNRNFPKAEVLFKDAIGLLKKQGAVKETIISLNALTACSIQESRFIEAETYARAAIQEVEKLKSGEDKELISRDSRKLLMDVLMFQQKYNELEKFLKAAINDANTERGKSGAPSCFDFEVLLARVYAARNEIDKFKELVSKLSRIARTVPKEKFRAEKIDLARMQSRLKQYKEAEILLRSALETEAEADAITCSAMSELGLILKEEERFSEAEVCLQDSLKMRRRIFSANTAPVADSMLHLSQLYIQTKRFADARALVTEALTAGEALRHDPSMTLLNSVLTLSALESQSGRSKEALETLRMAYQKSQVQGSVYSEYKKEFLQALEAKSKKAENKF